VREIGGESTRWQRQAEQYKQRSRPGETQSRERKIVVVEMRRVAMVMSEAWRRTTSGHSGRWKQNAGRRNIRRRHSCHETYQVEYAP